MPLPSQPANLVERLNDAMAKAEKALNDLNKTVEQRSDWVDPIHAGEANPELLEEIEDDFIDISTNVDFLLGKINAVFSVLDALRRGGR